METKETAAMIPAVDVLENEAGITVNKNGIPFENFVPSCSCNTVSPLWFRGILPRCQVSLLMGMHPFDFRKIILCQ